MLNELALSQNPKRQGRTTEVTGRGLPKQHGRMSTQRRPWQAGAGAGAASGDQCAAVHRPSMAEQSRLADNGWTRMCWRDGTWTEGSEQWSGSDRKGTLMWNRAWKVRWDIVRGSLSEHEKRWAAHGSITCECASHRFPLGSNRCCPLRWDWIFFGLRNRDRPRALPRSPSERNASWPLDGGKRSRSSPHTHPLHILDVTLQSPDRSCYV